MKIAFLALVIALITLLAAGGVLAAKKKNRFSNLSIKLIFTAILILVSYTARLFLTNRFYCSLLYAVYYISLDCILFLFYEYILLFINRDLSSKKYVILRYVYFSCVLVDSVSILSSVFTESAFYITSKGEGANLVLWNVEYSWPFYLHLLFCYIVVLNIFIELLHKLSNTERFLRAKYQIISFVFFITIVMNAMFMFLSWEMDYSIIIYGIMAVFVCYYTFGIMPNAVITDSLVDSSESISCAIACFDRNGKCTYVNIMAKEIFGSQEEDLIKIEKYVDSFSGKMLEGANDKEFYIKMDDIEINGEKHTFEVEYYRIRDCRKRVIGSYLKMDDLTEEVILVERENYRATHDELTGLFNRESFIKKATDILKKDPDEPRYLICTNIKDFKLINEMFGEELGNKLLVFQAQMLKMANYEDCIAGRMSGDRFAMLISKKDFKMDLAIKNTHNIKKTIVDVNYSVHMYLGVYEISDPNESIIAMCDKALLAIESIYGDYEKIMVFYNQDHMERLVFEQKLINGFDRAIQEEEFNIKLQPQLNINKEVIGAEALVSWVHPELGILEPSQFLPILEKAGYVHNLDQYVWEKAIELIKKWKEEANSEFYISVNISTRDFYYIDLVAHFNKLIRENGVEAKKIKLEITESAVMHDAKAHIKAVEELQMSGFEVDMDDFGNGFSSLNMLQNINVNALKIDMEYLGQMDEEGRCEIILRNIVSMAQRLGIKIVVESVETQEQDELVNKLNVDVLQGFYYHRPMDISEFEDLYIWRKAE